MNPASLAVDTGTSTLVDSFDAEDVAAAAGTDGDWTCDRDNGYANACRDDEIRSQLSH